MSMISAQCDELRERAKELRNLAPDPDVPYLVPSTKETMALAMRSAAGEMEDAADTIWQLRDDLQRTNAKFNAENAKLRELAERAWKAAEMLCQAWDGPCRADGVSIMTPCPMNERDELCVYGWIQRGMRELGVGVDG